MHATHMEDLRKYFAKDALEMIVPDVEYGYWLKKTALTGTIENNTATPEDQISVAEPEGKM